ncbi:MAG: Ig-like domain-containing protein [Candidatus Falkowbacteria bacterium]|nr:Ig-like domain-containing protein [Candidatus Falkowbacteria bacterium]
MAKKVKLIGLSLSFLAILLATNLVLAADFGVNEVSNGLGGALSATDPRIIIGRIIQWALSFLGVIAIALTMYAGFLWMTSGGEEEKVSQAKKILQNAVIGLVIILSAWGITTFILTRLIAATGTNLGDNNNESGTGSLNAGIGSIGACTIASTYPESGQTDVPRNTSIMVTFKEELQVDSICVNNAGASCACNLSDCNKINPVAIRFYKTELGDACSNSTCPSSNTNVTDVLVSVTGVNKILVLMPLSALGSANSNTAYSIKLTSQVKKLDGNSMFKNCNSNLAQWDFTVNTKFDLTPPLVVPAGIFPLPDNQKDVYKVVTAATAATGAVTVNSCPDTYASASINSVSPATAAVVLNYHGGLANFRVVVPADAPDKAQLFDSSNNLLGVADFNATGVAVFANFLTLTATSHPAGSLWTISVTPERLADTLTVNNTVYTFTSTGENNNIIVPAVCSLNAQAANIQAKLSGHPDIDVSLSGVTVGLSAKVAGTAGNNIAVTTTNTGALSLSALSGGQNRQELNQPKDRQDRPMNSAIQINFNEAINPVTVSGSASEVYKYIRVVNANASSSAAGTACGRDADCRSYKCQNSVCVGDYLGGKFTVSNAYRTLEFISDVKCGVNGCGEEIYCLPANSHLSIELMAANLKTCTTDNDCLAFAPYKTCGATAFSYRTCQDSEGHNYPTANLSSLDGIVDAAINSFDGDRNTYSDGPLDFYNDNYDATVNVNKKDKYKWSFYINDQIRLTPPQITSVTPVQGQSGIGLADPITINFDTLMLNSTLDTGSALVNNGSSTFEHKLINLRSSAPSALGYWISSENQDVAPLDGEPDLTIVKIFHSPLAESLTFKAQVGSGVKDIYQNCYKPSIGPGCNATAEQPSCCFGSATNTLGADGNCQ